MRRTYEIDLTDHETGATSPIDTQYVDGDYTAEQYIADCENNADPDWCEMLRSGSVEVVEVGIFNIEAAETGEMIEAGLTYNEAIETIKQYEAEDIAEGDYTKGFYAIRNTETDECETIINTYPHEDPDARREALAAELDEMIALGWTADEAIEDPDAFFERIGKFAEGIPKEEIWEIWERTWETKMEEGEMLSNNYYWLDTTETWNSPRKGEMILIRGQYNEDGEKDRDTEEEVLKFTEADCGIVPGDDDKAWKKVDAYIESQLGYMIDYEIN